MDAASARVHDLMLHPIPGTMFFQYCISLTYACNAQFDFLLVIQQQQRHISFCISATV